MPGLLEIDEDRNQRMADHSARLAARRQSDLGKVLSFPEGRRFVFWVLSFCQVYALSFGESDRHTNLNEGKRSVGIELLKQIPPEVELAMKRESANDTLLQTKELKEIADE